MIPTPSGGRVWIATGHTDMRRGMQGLALERCTTILMLAISTSSEAVGAGVRPATRTMKKKLNEYDR